jgi:hypothetical protein
MRLECDISALLLWLPDATVDTVNSDALRAALAAEHLLWCGVV